MTLAESYPPEPCPDCGAPAGVECYEGCPAFVWVRPEVRITDYEEDDGY